MGRRAPIVISSAETRSVSTASILLFGLRSVNLARQVLSTCHRMHSVAQGCADGLQVYCAVEGAGAHAQLGHRRATICKITALLRLLLSTL